MSGEATDITLGRARPICRPLAEGRCAGRSVGLLRGASSNRRRRLGRGTQGEACKHLMRQDDDAFLHPDVGRPLLIVIAGGTRHHKLLTGREHCVMHHWLLPRLLASHCRCLAGVKDQADRGRPDRSLRIPGPRRSRCGASTGAAGADDRGGDGTAVRRRELTPRGALGDAEGQRVPGLRPDARHPLRGRRYCCRGPRRRSGA